METAPENGHGLPRRLGPDDGDELNMPWETASRETLVAPGVAQQQLAPAAP